MSAQEPSPEMQAALKRYLEIQEEDNRLREEKAQLQQQIGAFMQGAEGTWFPEVDGVALTIRKKTITNVSYNEEILHERLGPQYTMILEPDVKKMKTHKDDVARCLQPIIQNVGSPSRDKVKQAIEQKLIDPRAFAGAFEKEEKVRISVVKQRGKGAEA